MPSVPLPTYSSLTPLERNGLVETVAQPASHSDPLPLWRCLTPQRKHHLGWGRAGEGG